MTLNEFLRGFAESTGLSRVDADEQWAWFSRDLTDHGRENQESGGYDAGVMMGREFRKLYPVEENHD